MKTLVALAAALCIPAFSAPPAGDDTAARYERAAAFLEPGGLAYAYLSTDGVRAKINTLLDQGQILAGEAGGMIRMVRGALFDLGLGDMGEWGMSTVPAGDGIFRSRYHLGFKGGHRGVLWSIWAPTPEKTLPGLALTPPDAVVAFGLRPDAKGLADKFTAWIATTPLGPEFDKAMKQAEEEGLHPLEMLRAAGTEWVVSLQLDALRTLPTPMGPVGEPSLLIALKSTGPGFRRNLDSLVEKMKVPLAADAPPVPGMVRIRDEDMPTFLQPCWGESNGWFILATQPKLYADTVARLSGKGDTLASTPEYKTLSAGLPAEGSQFFFVSGKLKEIEMRMMKASGDERAPAIPLLEALMSDPSTMSVTQVSGQALQTTANTRADPITDAMLVPAAGLGAALILPAIAKARTAAVQARDMNSLRQVMAGRMMALNDDPDKVPTLEEVAKKYLHGMDVSRFETTDAWLDKHAYGAGVVIVREKKSTQGRRAVGYADLHTGMVSD